MEGVMKQLFTKLYVCIITIALYGCANSLDNLQRLSPEAHDFQSALAKEYLALAEAEASQYDWLKAHYFADKGLSALEGHPVLPERYQDWDVDPNEHSVLTQARLYLEGLLENPLARKRFYNPLAKAQVLHDCWLEQKEEGWQEGDIAYCREEFYDVVDRLYVSITPEPTGQLVSAQDNKNDAIAPLLPSPLYRKVYFAHDSAAISQVYKQKMAYFAQQIKEQSGYDITINGHADRSGEEEYNLKLSLRRAKVVREKLTKEGLNKNVIALFAFGETRPLVPTKDGVREQENRVAEIIVETLNDL